VVTGADVPEKGIKRQIGNSYDLIKPESEETSDFFTMNETW
jgi:hypothetical protein